MILLLLSCALSDCPPGTGAVPALEARLRARLRPEDLPEPAAICFGPSVEPAITASGVVQLDEGWEEAANAARLAHLLLHRRQALGPEPACGAWRRAEDEARALEARLRSAAGLGAALPKPLDAAPPSCEDRGGARP